jgi:endonuclease/exonuclease/phosphatase family metal-dependent hydrolase
MLRRGTLLLIALLAGACAHTPTMTRSAPLRVMTYNIFAGNDLERSSNLERIARLADSLRVDVLFLQEVDRRTARSGDIDQAGVIAQRSGLHVSYGAAMPFDGGEYGIALLSRRPLDRVRVVPLGPPADSAGTIEPRVLLHAVITHDGEPVHVLNTHLDHRAERTLRNAQLLDLLAWVADSVPPGAAVVFGGDFNTTPESAAARAVSLHFTDAWRACGSGAGHTFRADRPDRRIDYIWLSRAHCTRAWVSDLRLSDHRPVIVDIEIDR